MSLSKQNAAARVAQLPLVRSAFTNLLDLYGDAKSGNPGFGSVCEGLESSVKQLASVVSHRVSPAITKLNPQVSLANDVACKTLDWLEATFPVLQTSSDQLVAGLRSKVMEMQDAVSIAAHGTVDSVQHAVMCIMASAQQPGDRSLMGRAISVSSMGLASALNITEALVDRMLPPLEEEKNHGCSLHIFRSASYPADELDGPDMELGAAPSTSTTADWICDFQLYATLQLESCPTKLLQTR
ncbi:perilipin-2-like isoform X4 [Corythoichthys intestinalis]|uniref:perilipin-2-like isoform X4 n=1 Tax=Corythoichthys intestinalis TaxID=161448 RepID=UPI0025A56D15|nr:perilipin-2-like isoform X4 [Corythoichthys intestinalis]